MAQTLTQDDLNAIANAVWGSLTANHTVNNSFGQRVLRSTTSQSTVAVTGSNHVAADIHEIQAGAIVDSDFAAGSIYAKLGTLIEADPVSGFRYTTQALEQAPSGGAGDASQATLLQVKAKTDQLTFTTPNKVDSTFYGEVPVVINQPVSGGNQRIDIIRGDTYNDIRKPKLRFTVSKNYAGCTITLTVRHRVTDAILLTKTGAVDSSTILSVELTGTDTAFSTLPLDEYGLHIFDLQATDGSNNRETIILGGSAVLSLDQTR